MVTTSTRPPGQGFLCSDWLDAIAIKGAGKVETGLA